MKLGHPNIVFPLVIGKRYIRIGHEVFANRLLKIARIPSDSLPFFGFLAAWKPDQASKPGLAGYIRPEGG